MMKINPDKEHVVKVVEALDKRNGMCPCRTDDVLCPCPDFYNEDKCICRLFIKK